MKISQVSEWSPGPYSLDGRPTVHQGLCCTSGEGTSDGKDEK